MDSALGAVGAPREMEARTRSRHVERVKESDLDVARAQVDAGRAGGNDGHFPVPSRARLQSGEFGTSVYRYAIRSRLAKALDAVLDSNLDLTTIALDAGFASHSHFTARFRAFFGVRPTPCGGRPRSGEARPAAQSS
jgi:methylphosphotriester-DNA--protein-cysteine methyltransferase